MTADVLQSRELRSLVKPDLSLELSLHTVSVPEPGADEVLVRIEGAPINPTDLALLFGPADLSSAICTGTDSEPVVTAAVPEKLKGVVQARIGESLPAGFEGAGVVVGAGSSAAAQDLLGRTVAMTGDGMFSQYRCVPCRAVMVMEEGVTPREAASSFVNPMTALSMVETMRMDGHSALVHTAAASNLGQMLNRICLNEGIGLVNVVRSSEQEALLRGMGAEHVVNSTADDFRKQLTDTIAATGATVAFDATGGGRLGNTILSCMERAAARGQQFSRYGSETFKQLYVYGRLDLTPMQLTAAYGFAWGVNGWLLSHFMARAGDELITSLKQKIGREIRTTFASHYAGELSLQEALSPERIAVYSRRATGKKYLINPNR
ncbi:MAG: zinc-binding dehydrogenase [Halieaceae bacterium]|nr:zinc-binding dehydrogenase [Halieaceae bacterium]